MLDLVLFPLVTPRRALHGGTCVSCGYGLRLPQGFAVEETDPLLAGFGVGVSCVDDTGFEEALQDDAFAPGQPVRLLPSVDGLAGEVSVWSADGVRLAGVVHGDLGAQHAATLAFGVALTARVLSEDCGVHDGVRRGISIVAGPSTGLALTVEEGAVLRPARTDRARLVLIADGSGDVDLWDPSGRQGPVSSTAELPLSPDLRARLAALQHALAAARADEQLAVGVDRVVSAWEAEGLDEEALLVWRRLRAELGRRCVPRAGHGAPDLGSGRGVRGRGRRRRPVLMREPSTMAPTFADLCTAMALTGVDVRVALEAGHHVIRLVDHHGLRSLDVPVARGFDREVGALCCSLALCADVPGCGGPGVELARRWPELGALARSGVRGATDPA